MRIFVGVILFHFLFSCADLEKSKQLNQLSSLNKKNDSLSIVLRQINDSQLIHEIEQKNNLLSDLMDYSSSDTLIESEAKLIDKYVNNIESLSFLKSNLEKLKLTLAAQKTDLKNLGNDIKNGSGKRNMYNPNLNFELKKWKRIKVLLTQIKNKKTKTINQITILKQNLRLLIQKLQSKIIK
jgi:hypothetical protein